MNTQTDSIPATTAKAPDEGVGCDALFGTFRAELWEADEYVITCKAGPIGMTLTKSDARMMAEWLNRAMPEAVKKLSLPNVRNLPRDTRLYETKTLPENH